MKVTWNPYQTGSVQIVLSENDLTKLGEPMRLRAAGYEVPSEVLTRTSKTKLETA